MESDISFTAINFFQLAIECHFLPPDKKKSTFLIDGKNFKKYQLPDLSKLTYEKSFAKVAMGWNNEGIEFYAIIDKPYERSVYPNLSQGDSFEVCIDTRNVKTSGYNTRFCHHFFCLAEPIEGVQSGEITKFRTEDMHELCDPKGLKVKSELSTSQYHLHFFIPSFCMHGYDPEQFDQLGFTYRINRLGSLPLHFTVKSNEYTWEQQPSLWSSIKLIP